MISRVHEALVANGAFLPVTLGSPEERLWLDCDLASLAENRLGERLDPGELGDELRARWTARASEYRASPLARRSEYERCYWVLEGEELAGTVALSTDSFGRRDLTLASLYVRPGFRGRGLGSKTLGRIQQALQPEGLGFRLETSWCWRKTVDFYVRFGLWVAMWKRELMLCWAPRTPPPIVEIGASQASLSVSVEGERVTLLRASRAGDRLTLDYPREELSKDPRLGDAPWRASSTLALHLALAGWPLLRSEGDWERSRWADGGPPEALAYRIAAWEAWSARRGWLITAPRIPGLPYESAEPDDEDEA